ncbi:SulP family inorganic anion transporter [Natronospirillum operosum]|uniref:SulP family inorganic anion transporter n=1 Tax=Natronospirillum operosum TaxID=2759953 RepID=A0A4Z0W944_9GAMM|nr:SulP family inorganic anion transporter [Natronospirillum operosum]TGG93529.1 SulP family inorganic anion transporter [Natronospirillum operosum]
MTVPHRPNWSSLGQDVSAGLLVALIGIPQCLAYAMLAGVPPMYGLSTAIVAGGLAALLGRSHRVTVGPTNTTGLIVLASLTPYAGHPDQLLPAMAILTLLAGAWRLVIVIARAERIFNFIPEAVMLGFATGAACLIAWMQIDDLLGQPQQGVRTAWAQAMALGRLDWAAVDYLGVGLGVTALVGVLLGRRLWPRSPVALIMLLLTTLVTVLLPEPFKAGLVLLGESALITNGWPTGAWPALDPQLWGSLLVPALAIALIGSLELIVTLRTNREMHYLTPELRAQGIANMVAALASAFPASASLTRSALLKLGNAHSRLAPFLAAVVLLPVLLFGGDWIAQIPLGVIAGLLIATAWTMLDQPGIRRLWIGNRQTRLLFGMTLASTLIIPFHHAILVGVGLSVGLFLWQTSQAHLRWFGRDRDDLLFDLPATGEPDPSLHDGRLYLQVSGSLYFAAAKTLSGQVQQALPAGCRHLMIDLTHAHQLRISAVFALQEIVDHCQAAGLEVEIGGVDNAFVELCRRCGVQLPFADWTLQRQVIRS